MAADPRDPTDVYDAYLATCLDGCPEEPDLYLARYPDVDTEMRELVHALHREYVAASSDADGELPFERLGGYRLVRRLGTGGMGTVFLAEQEALGRIVALKIVRPELGASATMLRRFRREARAIAQLRHPAVVSVYELAEDQDVQFIAMEFVPGRSLAEILREEGTAIPIHRLFQWMAQLARALAYAHKQGIVHRDVKPSNVLITPDDRAVLLDFGIAHMTGLEATRLTKSFAGSPLYAAPEQIKGGDVDARTDVYLLGITAYECVTGGLPFRGKTLEGVFRQVLLEDAVPPSRLNPSVPRDADLVVLKAMEKKPSARYDDMSAFADDLEALSRSRPVRARAPGPITRLRKWTRRRPVTATAVSGLLVAVLTIVALLIYGSAQRAAERRQEALQLVERARGVLADYREARIDSKDYDEGFRELLLRYESRHTTEEQDRQLEDMTDRGEKAGTERDLMFSRVLELLHQAQQRDRDVPGVDEVTARLWLERMEEARTQANEAAVRRYRAEIAKYDPDGRYTGALLKSGSIRASTTPAGFELHAFRHDVQRDLDPGGDRRLVPVPVRGETPVLPGTWTLRVVRGAGDLRQGDQILEVFGHPIEATFLAADSHGEVRRGDRLVAIGKRRIRLMLDGRPPDAPGPHRYVFARDDREFEVRWNRPPIEVLSAAAVAERGNVPARVYQDGVVREMQLPVGLVVRTTAVPLFASPGSRIGITPTEAYPLEPGRYVFLLRRKGYEDQILQRKIRGGWDEWYDLKPLPIGTTPPGFVYISVRGTDEDAFWMQEREVTNAEYLEFLNDPAVLAEIDAALEEGRYIRYPRDDQLNTASGGHWIRNEHGRFELPPTWRPDRPVRGLDLADAKAYAAWRGARDGRPYRIPTHEEYRGAAHGNSFAGFAHGDVFRPKWVSSLHVTHEFRGYDPVMSFPIDESPAGVYDLCGSVIEWMDWDGTRGFSGMAAGGSVLRGRGWEFSTTARHPRDPEHAGGDCGFRLVFRRRDLE